MTSAPRAIGVDVGGTAVKAGVVDAGGTLTERRDLPTPREPDALVAAVATLVRDLRRAAGADLPVGVAVPGIVDDDAGTVALSANLGWRDVPVRDLLAAALAEPVAVGHDVRAGALAESRWGAGADAMLFVPIGTGIAAALVLDGRPWGTGFAGEIGHVLVTDPDGGPDLPLERVASAAALARRCAAGGEVTDGAREVFRRLADRDPRARTVVADALDRLADVLAGAVCLLGPVRIVIGGGLAGAGEDLLGPLRERLAERLVLGNVPEVVPAALGPWAGCMGAAALALPHPDGGVQ
ncbi:ROK family protein [Georgenia subflava]|uniref:ROK family protein n=1 Tax=Georgenia subflava TaxID=1622177 RepID=A0A6N7EKC2_9MICO|nr:ROK family protein [Georgenia subflava]MPV38599.1 ROK family protein [Georgenia subflava]